MIPAAVKTLPFRRQLLILATLVLVNMAYAGLVLGLLEGQAPAFVFSIQLAMVALISALVFAVLYRMNKNRLEYDRAVKELESSDKLTGLTSRAGFEKDLHDRIKQDSSQNPFAFMLIDIDRFKELNASLGFQVGDSILEQIGSRLLESSDKKSECARLNGNEFAILVSYDGSSDDLEIKMRELLVRLYQPYTYGKNAVSITISAGVTLFPDDGEDGAHLNRNAQLALQRAKQEGADRIIVFDEIADNKLHDFQLLSRDMDRALKAGEFKLFYQPQFSFKTGEQTGYEALIRWQHPERGLISPADFIPIAEKNGLIIPISENVLRQACSTASKWPNPLSVAVNLSPIQLNQTDFHILVDEVLLETGLDPKRLELEVTESLFVNLSDKVAANLKRLQETGVTISLDDFGTGYSSLQYLTDFPFDKIKIDQSFVRNLAGDDGSMAIITAIISLSKSLGMRITAEGVESDETHEILRLAGCDHA